jgi:hypothetical protein
MPRKIKTGDTYTIDDDIELEEVTPEPNQPPEELRGEPWGWTKPGPKPRGWRRDGDYGA